jgi:DNA-binding LacI/PurR family transcriptional regulator
MPTAFERYSSIPKYIRLAEELRTEIHRNKRKPGERLPSFAEMQQLHGVSQALLERAYRLLEEDKLIVRRAGSGIFVADPQDLSERPRTHTIGLSGYPLEEGNPLSGDFLYWTRIYEGIFSQAHQAGYDLLHVGKGSRSNWEKVDGVLIYAGRDSIGRLRVPIMPTVSLLSVNEGVASVTSDDYAGIKQLMNHLLESGHRRIARLYKQTEAVPMPQDNSEQRAAAYRDALREAGISAEASWQRRLPDGPFDAPTVMQRGYAAMSSWLADESPEGWRALGCTALVAQNDAVALGAIKAFNEAGLRVPEDVSVTGFDGYGLNEMFHRHLTTVEVPLREIGARAMALLLRQMTDDNDNEEEFSRHEMLATRLRIAETTGPAPR